MSHSIVGKGQAVKECTACHSSKSMLHRPLDLNTFLPKSAPVIYRGRKIDVVNFEGKEPTFDNRVLLQSFYIIGQQPVAMGGVARVAGGGCRRLLQYFARNASSIERSLMTPVTTPLYSLHERIWHWLQAAVMILLIVSGFAIHYPDRFRFLGSMALAIRWHAWLGALLIVNAFLGAFYHLTAEKYHHFLPRMDDFTGRCSPPGAVLPVRHLQR